jgi:hypothetical protein
VSNPSCPQPIGEAYWVVNGGNQIQKDCTQGRDPVAVGQPATPLVGLFQPGDPTVVGRSGCGPTSCVSTTHTRFGGGELGVGRTLTLTGWSWPSIAPVTYVSIRVSHFEQRPNLVPSVNISIAGGGSCDIPVPSNTTGYVDFTSVLPSSCAPDTESEMQAMTLTYTVTCQASYQGNTFASCGGGGNSNPYAFLDAIVFDLEYELGGQGGTPMASFTATSGTTTVSADAVFGDSTDVSNYRVT